MFTYTRAYILAIRFSYKVLVSRKIMIEKRKERQETHL